MPASRHGNAGRRFLAAALCAVLMLSLLAGIIPAMDTAASAASDPLTRAEIFAVDDRVDGHIVIQMLDSSVPGADQETKGSEHVASLNAAFNGTKLWADGMTTEDLVQLGEGLGRMEGRGLLAYDITDVASAEGHNDTILGWYGNECVIMGNLGGLKYYTDHCLVDEKHAGDPHTVEYTVKHTAKGSYMVIDWVQGTKNDWLQPGHRYVLVEDGDQNHMFYGYLSNDEILSVEAGGRRGWQLSFAWGDHDAEDGSDKPNLRIWYQDGDWQVKSVVNDAGTDMSGGTQPIHNEIMRAGFSFNVKDVETDSFVSNGAGNIGDSVFAVFNISSTALAPYAYDMGDAGFMMPPTNSNEYTELGARGQEEYSSTGYGYVTVDSNGDNVISESEGARCFPAYSYLEVVNAWKAYLSESATIPNGTRASASVSGTYVNGAYGNGKYASIGVRDDGGNDLGLFVMGQTAGGMPIVPCMVLKPDANGKVSMGKIALPAGNYVVLQVKAGTGSYVDENFRPVVAIGPWYTGRADRTAQNGYGNMAYGQLAYNLDTTAAMYQADGRLGVTDGSYGIPVAYVGASTDIVADITMLDTTSRFFVDRGGYKHDDMNGSNEPGPLYRNANSILAAGGYAVNVSKGDPTSETSCAKGVGSRRLPEEGYSRFTAYTAPVRAGVRFYVGDADDIEAAVASGTADAGYVIEPQGDGELAGAKFRIYNNIPDADINALLLGAGSSMTGTHTAWAGVDEVATEGNVKASAKKELPRLSAEYQEYTVYKDAAEGKYYFEVPVDELPYGVFGVQQVLTGEGYGSWDGHEDENWNANDAEKLTPIKLCVMRENEIIPSYDGSGIDRAHTTDNTVLAARISAAMTAHQIGGSVYLPQTLVDGGYMISVDGTEGTEGDIKATVKVFNISEHYVYVDKDGTETKVPTSKTTYEQRVKGKALTVAQIDSITSAWASCVKELRDMPLGDIQTAAEGLPYGTYLIAVTDVTEGYAPITGAFGTDSIDYEGDRITFSVRIMEAARVPVMATTLLDHTYQLDSVPWRANETLVDVIELGNLQEDMEYTAYGILVDTETGEMVPGTGVSVAERIKAHVSTGTENPGSSNTDAELRELLATGEAFSTVFANGGGSDQATYGVWLYKVSDWAKASNDAEMVSLVNRALGQYDSSTSGYGTNYFTTGYHTPLVARMRYLARDISGGTDLTGTQTASIYYNALNVRNDIAADRDLEGKKLSSTVVLCEGGKTDAAMAATDLDSLMAATEGACVLVLDGRGDEEETAYVASLDVSAEAVTGGGKVLDPSEGIKANVRYGNVETGNDYRISIKLKDADGAWVKDKSGAEATVNSGTFRATASTGTFSGTFDNVDLSKYTGQRLTAYATLERVVSAGQAQQGYWLIEKGDAATMGYSASDEDPGKNQVDIRAAGVKTVLADAKGNKSVDFDSKVNLVDTVEYTGLVAGARYESVLTLVDSKGSVLEDDDGRVLTATKSFTMPADDTTGKYTLKLELSFDGTTLLGQKIIAYNDLYRITADRKILVVQEHDTSSADQTIKATGTETRILFSTVARDDATNTHYAIAGADATFTDRVTIRNVDPSTKYVLKTDIARANNGKILTQFETLYTQVTSDGDGDIIEDIPLSLNTNPFKGESLVVYQTLYDVKGKEVIAQHRSSSDSNEMLHVADLSTVATAEDGRSKSVPAELVENESIKVSTQNGEAVVTSVKNYTYEATVADRVYYDNLVPGNEYTVTTQAVSRKNGAPIGRTVQNYTPSSSSGSFTVYLDLDVTDYLGQDIVIYERITDAYFTSQVIVVHEDIDDEDQTVKIIATSVPEKEEPAPTPVPTQPPTQSGSPGNNTGKNIQTDVAEHYGLFFGIAALLAAAAAGGGIWYYKSKKRG